MEDQATSTKIKAGLLLLALACSAKVLAADAGHVYTTDFSAAMKLGGDLHDALSQNRFDQVDVQAVALEPLEVPLIAPVSTSADNHVKRQVELSAGFIDLVNHLCHAKAIDKVQAGFFDQYVGQLAHAYAANPAAPIPPIADPRFWTDDILNDQLSNFNQMMGMIMSINMAHHYLGHYAKYAAKLAGSGDKLEPINNLLTPAEWDNSVKAGVLDALNCALSTEGVRSLFEALDKMPARPAWAAYIAPQNVDLKKLNQDLARYEDDFYHGRIKN